MIKKLLLLAHILLLSSCSKGKCYQNVYYTFDPKTYQYIVYVSENEKHELPPSNYYLIEVDSYRYTKNRDILLNEYFLGTNELFVYQVK